MVKYLVISDIHTKNIWKKIIKQCEGKFDKVIFLGDYIDRFLTFQEKVYPELYEKAKKDSLNNLKEIIKYKKQNMDKVELLIGNHDYQYFLTTSSCSGYDPSMHRDLQEIFLKNKDFFNLFHLEGNWLFSHAGISQGFWEFVQREYLNLGKHLLVGDLPKVYFTDLYIGQDLPQKEPKEMIFNSLWYVAGYSRGGRNRYGGPLWADMNELVQLINKKEGYAYKGIPYYQVVGHTMIKDVVSVIDYEKEEGIIFTDCIPGQEKVEKDFNVVIVDTKIDMFEKVKIQL